MRSENEGFFTLELDTNWIFCSYTCPSIRISRLVSPKVRDGCRIVSTCITPTSTKYVDYIYLLLSHHMHILQLFIDRTSEAKPTPILKTRA